MNDYIGRCTYTDYTHKCSVDLFVRYRESLKSHNRIISFYGMHICKYKQDRKYPHVLKAALGTFCLLRHWRYGNSQAALELNCNVNFN